MDSIHDSNLCVLIFVLIGFVVCCLSALVVAIQMQHIHEKEDVINELGGIVVEVVKDSTLPVCKVVVSHMLLNALLDEFGEGVKSMVVNCTSRELNKTLKGKV